MRTIGAVTVARSDYGIYRPVLRALQAHHGIEPRLFVGGAHLLDRFGDSVAEIDADGFAVAERVAFLDGDDSPLGVARGIGRGVTAFADAFARRRLDMLLLLGDRAEMLAAGVAAAPLSIPLAHIHGGESSEGALDDAFRHALTKLSHLHFVATQVAAGRVVQLGEEPWRVTVSGAPALDAIRQLRPLSDEELEHRGIRLRGPTLLVTYHPVTLGPADDGAELDAILAAVAESRLDAVFTYPGADARHGLVIERLERFAASDERYTLVRTLGQDAYLTLLGRVAAMVGNSSSGIIEAASFALPVVDVGGRQRGRLRAANVLSADGARDAIAEALARAVDPAFRTSLAGLVNAYGDGHAAERIAARLAEVELGPGLLVKRFHDLGRGDGA